MPRAWQNWDVGRIAETVDAYWRSNGQESLHRDNLIRMASRYLTDPKVKVLEVGCGSGLIYERLVPHLISNTKYTGIDVAEKMLAVARRNFPNGRFLSGDGYKLDFEDKSFDVVLSFEVLGHIPNIDRFVNEMLRVTARTCIFTVWPSSGEEIITTYEEIDGTRFLHQQYSDAYLRRIIRTVRPELSEQVSVAAVSEGVRAYIVSPTGTSSPPR
jgi:ubiquinone/menaquinone biosynthesis C-methylase UbiE